MNGEVSCAAMSTQISAGGNPAGSTVMAIQRALTGEFRNPYGANWPAFGDEEVREGGWGNERDLGYVLLNAGGDTGFFRINVSVCHQLPCTGDRWVNPGDNVIVKVYRWFP